MAIGGAQPGNVSAMDALWVPLAYRNYFTLLQGRRWGSGKTPRCNPSTTQTSFFGRFPVLLNSPRCSADIVTSYSRSVGTLGSLSRTALSDRV